MTVNKSLAKVKGKTIIQTPKTATSRRKITLPRFVVEHLQEYVKLLYGYKPSDRLFLVDKYALARMMNKYSELSGVEEIRIHNLRHSHASLLIHLGERRVRTKFWTTIGLRKEPFYVFKRTKRYCTTDISSNRVCN